MNNNNNCNNCNNTNNGCIDNNVMSIVNVGSGGTFAPTGEYATIPSEIDDFFQYLRDNHLKKIAIHFHGGLVSESNGLKTAARMNDIFRQAGSQPVSFVWETGLIRTLTDNFTEVHETDLFQKILKIVIKVAIKKLGLEEGGKGARHISNKDIEDQLKQEEPFADFVPGDGSRGDIVDENTDDKQLEQELKAQFEEEFAADFDLEDIFRKEVPKSKWLNKEKVSEKEEDARRGIFSFALAIKSAVKIAFKVIKRFIAKRDHGLYPTVMEEILRELYIADIGSWVWGEMKEKAEEMWAENKGLDGLEEHAGRYFLERLSTFVTEHPDTVIDLTGHSAGSIVICYMLKAMAKVCSHVKVRNILFLAPACRCDLFHAEMVSHPERFEKLRIFTMSDEHETKDRLVPFIYTRSLLYLISGILEGKGESFDEPILGLQSHTDGKVPYTFHPLSAINDYLAAPDSNRVVYSVTPENQPPGFNSRARKHGNFDNDTHTLESIKHIIGE